MFPREVIHEIKGRNIFLDRLFFSSPKLKMLLNRNPPGVWASYEIKCCALLKLHAHGSFLPLTFDDVWLYICHGFELSTGNSKQRGIIVNKYTAIKIITDNFARPRT